MDPAAWVMRTAFARIAGLERLPVCATNSIRSLDPAFLRPGTTRRRWRSAGRR
ncbi:hypothetical protein ACFXPW_29105 [Streptomyces goshikiensis]|uniref:hypothetical protein n=1 Tax=Streptomyces goshikiensis TaxID=1942 RepID=UPI00369CE0EF